MKVIDFNEEEEQIKRDIERARRNMSNVEDLSDFGNDSKKNKKDDEDEPEGSLLKEVISIIFNVLICFVVVFLITHFVGQRTVVSGSSMEDTLSNGDNLIVDKISYRFHDPERFDVVVFPPYTEEENTYYIKRIIALPGEVVRIDTDGVIYINGEPLIESYGTEVMLNPYDAKEDILLGPDEYFVLGDNRNNSTDSRIIGSIKKKDIVGRAWLRMYPFSEFGLVEKID